MLDITPVQSNAVAYGDFIFENGGQFADARVQHTIVLHVGAVTDAYVIHIAARDSTEPDGGLLAHVHVTYYLRAVSDEGRWVNLRVNTTKGSNHEVRFSISSNS